MALFFSQISLSLWLLFSISSKVEGKAENERDSLISNIKLLDGLGVQWFSPVFKLLVERGNTLHNYLYPKISVKE